MKRFLAALCFLAGGLSPCAVLPVVAVPVVLTAGCATTSQGREVQIARGIITTNQLAVQALDAGIITPGDGEAVQRLTRMATDDLRSATAARRAGKPKKLADVLLDGAEKYILEAARLLEGRR